MKSLVAIPSIDAVRNRKLVSSVVNDTLALQLEPIVWKMQPSVTFVYKISGSGAMTDEPTHRKICTNLLKLLDRKIAVVNIQWHMPNLNMRTKDIQDSCSRAAWTT